MRCIQSVVAGVGVAVLCGCGGGDRQEPAAERPAFTVEGEPAGSTAADTVSEADRTRELEEGARAIDERQRELMESGASGAELERAAQELEAERQRLIQGESADSAGDEADDYEPPPPR